MGSLIFNRGSSSLKFAYFEHLKRVFFGEIEQLLSEHPTAWIYESGKKETLSFTTVEDLIDRFIQKYSVEVIGHRVVFGPKRETHTSLVTEDLLQELHAKIPFAPLHLPGEIALIEKIQEKNPKIPQYVCFDTAFHASLPQHARRFPLPQKYEEEGIFRRGFHGLVFQSIVARYPKGGKGILCHLGSGVSLCAVDKGKSVDTSMGLSPLGGVVMGTRPGDLDPGILLYLLKEKQYSFETLQQLLYKESGLLGLSGISGEMRRLLSCSQPDAKGAIELFCYSIKKGIGSYVAALEGIDYLIFSGGIGERSSEIREYICRGLTCLGITLDPQKNRQTFSGGIQEIHAGAVEIFVCEADEEWMIAKEIESL